MSLILSKLDISQRRPDGALVARCPACAQEGRDMTGNHLIVYPDGRFGCVVYAGATEQAKMHRRLIIALAGRVENGRRTQKQRSDAQVVLKPWWL